jgi:hypothetical protein
MHLLLDFSSIQMHHGHVDLSSRTLLTCNCRILDYGLRDCSTIVSTESSTLLLRDGGHDAPCCRSTVEAGMLNWYIPLISSFLTGNQKGKKGHLFFSIISVSSKHDMISV